MTRLAPHAAAAAGIFRRDMTVYLSYRWRLGAQYVGVLFSLAVFFYISRLVRVPAFPTPQAYFAYAAVGVIILQVLQATLDIPVAVRQELVAGTFERMAVSPFGPVASILSLFLFPIVSAVLTMLVTLALPRSSSASTRPGRGCRSPSRWPSSARWLSVPLRCSSWR